MAERSEVGSGDTVTGVVTGVVDFVVNVEGIEGLIHISELVGSVLITHLTT